MWDPGFGIEKFGSGIRKKHPGSATLVQWNNSCYVSTAPTTHNIKQISTLIKICFCHLGQKHGNPGLKMMWEKFKHFVFRRVETLSSAGVCGSSINGLNTMLGSKKSSAQFTKLTYSYWIQIRIETKADTDPDWVALNLKVKRWRGFLTSLAMTGQKAGWLVVMRMGRRLWFTRLFTAP
jgi:hypothetical protein